MFDRIKKLPLKYSLPLLILYILGIYLLLIKVITPMVLKVSESEVFMKKEDAAEMEELGKVSNERTSFAFLHCKSAMKTQSEVPENAQFADADYEAWALGNKTYLVRSHVMVSDQDKGAIDRKYACKITFNGGDATDASNWSTMGIDFNEPTTANVIPK